MSLDDWPRLRRRRRSAASRTCATPWSGPSSRMSPPCARQDRRVRIVPLEEISRRVAAIAERVDRPRVFASGNGAVPWPLLGAVDAQVASYRLFMLNAPKGVPTRDGVELETPFVGAGMRDAANLSYLPSRLSLVPQLVKTRTQPHVVLVNVSAPRGGLVS